MGTSSPSLSVASCCTTPRSEAPAPPVMYSLIRSLLFRLDPELAHDLTVHGLSALRPVLRALVRERKSGNIRAFGMEFNGQIGLAAGLDKNAYVGSLWTVFGFGFVEIGTVTPRPQAGRTPALFR